MGVVTNDLLESHAIDESEPQKTFEGLDPEALIIVSTFLARSPTSYGRGMEILSSREPQSPAPPIDYDLGGERDHLSLQQESILDAKSSDSEFLMTE